MTPAEFAQLQGVSERTVQRWLKDGEVPGARRREDGRWHLPADATRVVRLPDDSGDAADVSRHGADDTPRRDVAPTSAASAELAVPLQGLSLSDALARQPAFLDLPTASRFLGVPRSAIQRDPDLFAAQRFSRRWMVPQATVRRFAGL